MSDKYVSNTFRSLGSSSHALEDRDKYDYYATEPKATELLLELEEFSDTILEPCCGQGHISEVLKEHGKEVISYDLIDRGYGGVKDIFEIDKMSGVDIITNPPYRQAQKFVEKSLDIVDDGRKVAMFLKTLFLESQRRKKMFKKNPPKYVYVSSSRLICARGGEFEKYNSSAVSYSWFIWEKGYKGETIVRWFN